MARKVASGSASGGTKPGGVKPGKGQNKKAKSPGAALNGSGAKETRRMGIRTTRRITTDPFTTEIAAKEVIGLRHGKVEKPTPEPYVRAFPLAKTPQKQALKRFR